MKSSRFGRGSALGVGVTLLLLAALFPPPGAWAQSGDTKIERARQYYEEAQEARETLEAIPASERTESQYLRVIRAFQRVYLTAPAYGNNTVCLMAAGDLYQEMGRRWDPEKYSPLAIRSYEFLRREYPQSKFRLDALLTIARIYREDLGKPEEALQQYEIYLKTYPRSVGAEEARQAVAAIQTKLQARKAALAEAPASPPVPAQDNTPKRTSPPSRGLARLTDIRQWAAPDYTRVVIDLESAVKYSVGRLSNPPRIYVDLYGTQAPRALLGKTLPVKSDVLKSVRVGQLQPTVSRIVLDVGDRSDYTLFDLPNPYRLVIDVHTRTETTVASEVPPPGSKPTGKHSPVVAASRPSSAREEAPAKETPPAKTEPAEVAQADAGPVIENMRVAKPNSDGTRSLTRALGLKIGKIVLDPGHGGHDTGTIGPAGLQEKELVLDITQRLGKLIEERLSSEVVYTRTNDTFVSLEARTALANQKQADLFLSIHFNSSRNRRVRGVETYYLNFTSDPEALEVAARENAVSQETISQLQGLVSKIALQEKVDESKEFAGYIQSALSKSLSDRNNRVSDRGVKKAPFVVLIGANMPSVLAELSFLSNPQDETLLKTTEYRQKLAEALFQGLVDYAETLSGIQVARTTEADAATLAGKTP